MRPEITISIVNTNNRDVALQCLRSIYATCSEMLLEIIIVNNACTDGSSEAIRNHYPDVKIIEHEEMLGFSTNNNLALSKAAGRYLMLLNDDTITLSGAFQAMLSFADSHPDVGVVGANLLNPDMTSQKCYDFSPNPFYDGLQPFSEWLVPMRKFVSKPLEVDIVNGACMLVRTSAAQKIGYLDTRFDPLYSEEVDWCFRFKKSGWKIYHLPNARVIHLCGATMNRTPIARYERIFEKKALFFRKHYGKWTVLTYKLCLFLANLLKSLVWTLLWIFRRKNAAEEIKLHWHMVLRALFFLI
jgi:GT2 family glycosyltransferase